MTKFNIGDRVKIPFNPTDEPEGVVIQISNGATGGDLYLVETPRKHLVWVGEEDIKLISIKKEKVVFT